MISLVYFHTLHWGTYFAQVIPLQIKQVTKTATVEDLQSLANICTERFKPACVEKSFKEIVILHSFVKKTQKTPKKELDLAKNRMKEFKL